ncbi:hypothetical protein N9954_06175 [Maribacter sp.]|nr:hypothetical protein [Maribacter sp.]
MILVRNHLKILLLMVVLLIGCEKKFKEKPLSEKVDREAIASILKVLDDNDASLERKLSIWVDDLVHMAPDNMAITTKAALRKYLQEQATYGYSELSHQIVEVFPYQDIVLMRGKVEGIFYPSNKGVPFPFETKNLFVFRRMENTSLKIWKVIFNSAPQ